MKQDAIRLQPISRAQSEHEVTQLTVPQITAVLLISVTNTSSGFLHLVLGWGCRSRHWWFLFHRDSNDDQRFTVQGRPPPHYEPKVRASDPFWVLLLITDQMGLSLFIGQHVILPCCTDGVPAHGGLTHFLCCRPRVSLHPLEADRLLPGRLPDCEDW